MNRPFVERGTRERESLLFFPPNREPVHRLISVIFQFGSLRTADVFPVVASLPPAGETGAEKTGCSRRLIVWEKIPIIPE